MKNLHTTARITMIALLIGIFSSPILLANGTSGEPVKKEKSKDEIEATTLASTIMVDEDLLAMEASLREEGILTCNDDVIVKIMNESDELVYEGTYRGILVADKTLKKYMDKADLILNVGNVAYYMLF